MTSPLFKTFVLKCAVWNVHVRRVVQPGLKGFSFLTIVLRSSRFLSTTRFTFIQGARVNAFYTPPGCSDGFFIWIQQFTSGVLNVSPWFPSSPIDFTKAFPFAVKHVPSGIIREGTRPAHLFFFPGRLWAGTYRVLPRYSKFTKFFVYWAHYSQCLLFCTSGQSGRQTSQNLTYWKLSTKRISYLNKDIY